MRIVLQGKGASKGLALGRARVRHPHPLNIEEQKIGEEQVGAETERLREAIKVTRSEFSKLRARLHASLSDDVSEVLDLHAMLLDDPELQNSIESIIRGKLVSADYALKLQRDKLGRAFEALDDDYLRTRLDDLDHVIGRLHAALHNRAEDEMLGLAGEIMVAHDIAPAELAELKAAGLLAVVTAAGSPLSHSAIIARSIKLPMIVGVAQALNQVNDGDAILVDGRDGELIIEPDSSDLSRFHNLVARLQRKQSALQKLKSKPTRTKDGKDIFLYANAESREDIATALADQADGIGLYRTEFLFLQRNELPDELEQFNHYRDAVLGMVGKPVTFRTLDLGADKADRTGLALRNESNPALGLRGVRLSLARPDLLLAQIRAILRASAYGPVRILVPMISRRDELAAVRDMIDSQKLALHAEGISIGDRIEFGAMIEVPSAALSLPRFSDLIDFASIGTNDLVQYLLAVDRNHEGLGDLYSDQEPALLHLLRQLFDFGRQSKMPIALCGEMAADPENVPLLLALGLSHFSVHPSSLLEVRQAIRSCELTSLRRRAASLLRANSRGEVRAWQSKNKIT